MEQIVDSNTHKIPDVILIKKKEEHKEKLRLKRLDIEKEEGRRRGKKGKEMNDEDKEYDEFIDDIEDDPDLKGNVVQEDEKDEDLTELVNKMDIKK